MKRLTATPQEATQLVADWDGSIEYSEDGFLLVKPGERIRVTIDTAQWETSGLYQVEINRLRKLYQHQIENES